MRCPQCGTDNPSGRVLCQRCGRILNPIAMGKGKQAPERSTPSYQRPSQTIPAAPGSPTIDHRDIPKRMKLDYQHGVKDQTVRTLEALQTLLQHFQKRQPNVRDMLQDVGNLINKQFGIMYVGLGLRSPADGLYRYEVMVGFREDVQDFRRGIPYKKGDFYDDGPYKGHWISRFTKIFLAEDHPYANGEEAAYNRPILLDAKRHSLTDSLEGDYIDTMIFGPDEDLLGWVEYSGTRTGKMPDLATIKAIEDMACILSIAIMNYGHK